MALFTKYDAEGNVIAEFGWFHAGAVALGLVTLVPLLLTIDAGALWQSILDTVQSIKTGT